MIDFLFDISWIVGLIGVVIRPDWLTIQEAAEMLRIHPDTLKRWCRRGILAFTRVGRRGRGGVGSIRIARHTLEDYLARRSTPASPVHNAPQAPRMPLIRVRNTQAIIDALEAKHWGNKRK